MKQQQLIHTILQTDSLLTANVQYANEKENLENLPRKRGNEDQAPNRCLSDEEVTSNLKVLGENDLLNLLQNDQTDNLMRDSKSAELVVDNLKRLTDSNTKSARSSSVGELSPQRGIVLPPISTCEKSPEKPGRYEFEECDENGGDVCSTTGNKEIHESPSNVTFENCLRESIQDIRIESATGEVQGHRNKSPNKDKKLRLTNKISPKKSPNKQLFQNTSDVSNPEENNENVNICGAISSSIKLKNVIDPDSCALRAYQNAQKFKRNTVVDIREAIELDAKILNYGKFYTGKVLGSRLIIKNTSSHEQELEICIDKQNFFKQKYLDLRKQLYVEDDDLPFPVSCPIPNASQKEDGFFNSERLYNCWFVEHPATQTLVKGFSMKLPAGASKEIIIVLKGPQIKRSINLLSFLRVKLQKGGRDLDENGSKQAKRLDEKFKGRLSTSTEMRVLLLGRIDIPRIVCGRELVNSVVQQPVLPLAIKRTPACQKFRIPFKNNGDQDVEVEFSFLKTGDSQDETREKVEFHCVPSSMKIPADSSTMLNVLVKMSSSPLRQRAEEATKKRDKGEDLRMLVGKIKDSSLFYSFLIDAQVIN